MRQDTTPGPGHYEVSTQSTNASRMSHQTSNYSFGTKQKRLTYITDLLDSRSNRNQSKLGLANMRYCVSAWCLGRETDSESQGTRSTTSFWILWYSFPGQTSRATSWTLNLQYKGHCNWMYSQTKLQDGLIIKVQRGALGNFGTNVKRFHQSEFADQTPGPGNYALPGIHAPPPLV